MIKRYTSLFYFLKELPSLNNCIVIFPYNIDEQFMMLKSNHYKSVKKALERQHIKTIIEKERFYENNEHIEKAI